MISCGKCHPRKTINFIFSKKITLKSKKVIVLRDDIQKSTVGYLPIFGLKGWGFSKKIKKITLQG
ncbi:hypothetical protein AWN68_00970 [Roseivirga echinicomitans]|uniref:Uncharacterized protein n=1 Tax=Roseivirga echinicomitans TaxID=296218 RepID=A0A150XXI1_9BACT|nr:hypothetical protein AWN68_00970 [Roseivirga echinicomitans]